MRVFSLEGAKHFCRISGLPAGATERSVEDFRHHLLGRLTSISEGSALFEEYRVCALRDAERSLFLSASHYRRALDLMIPSSSHWAQVTLYYGAWFAARAILGMFGCTVLSEYIIDVARSAPGHQQLSLQRVGSGPGKYYVQRRGSHRRFWEIFYKAVISIRPFVDPSVSQTLSPVSNSDVWQIEERNKINYNTIESAQLGAQFKSTFSEVTFPGSLPGTLNTQFQICEGLLSVGCSFAADFGLTTDALDTLSPPAPFKKRVRELVYNPTAPKLVGKTKKHELFGR